MFKIKTNITSNKISHKIASNKSKVKQIKSANTATKHVQGNPP